MHSYSSAARRHRRRRRLEHLLKGLPGTAGDRLSEWVERMTGRALGLVEPLTRHPMRTHAPRHLLVGLLAVGVLLTANVSRGPAETTIVRLGDGLSDLAEDAAGAFAALESLVDLVTYIVEPGDTLKAIAARHDLSVATISGANRLDNPNRIRVGQALLLPPLRGTLHAINPNETLAQIAARYDVSPAELAEANRLPLLPDAPLTGQYLIVPGIEPDLPESGSGQAEIPRSTVSYVVQDGDSLRSLAQQFGVSVRTILVANDLADPDFIKIGMKLKVLPVSGVEHEVNRGETLADIAAAYRVDLGPIVDFNGLGDPDTLNVGAKLLIPGATARVYNAVGAASPALAYSGGGGAGQARLAVPAPVIAPGAPGLVRLAMNYLGYRYVFGGTSPGGFDCSGFVWYVHRTSGIGVSRGMWGQYNGGPRVVRANLLPGDVVFFANTYMPGLSHNGIYIGGGQFVHAIDESSGVGISSIYSAYWAPRYVGATRLF